MQYFYTDANHKSQGPVPREKILELLNNGTLNPATLIAEQGSQNWLPLSSLLAGTATPPPPGMPPMTQVTEPLSIWSLILSLVGAACCGIFGSIAAVICGHIARGRIKKNPALQGDGLALAGLIIGYLGAVFWLLYLVFFGFAMILAALSDKHHY